MSAVGFLCGSVPTTRSRCAAPRRIVCRAQAAAESSDMVSSNPLLVSAIDALFKVPPIFDSVKKKARQGIIDRADVIGLDWYGTVEKLESSYDWPKILDEVTDASITYPSYYTQPFHGYDEGRWTQQGRNWYQREHCGIQFPVQGVPGYCPQLPGDLDLRAAYNKAMQEMLADSGIDSVENIVDVGCSIGLSSLALLDAFPNAKVTGVDLSPHFLAVGKVLQEQRKEHSERKENIEFVHAKAESTPLPSNAFDMVSICLTLHELPRDATKNILKEAHRLLRDGGVLSIMEMDPHSSVYKRISSNPFAYAGFKSTEPWLIEYMTMDLHGAIQEAGFKQSMQKVCSPRHRTVVACK